MSLYLLFVHVSFLLFVHFLIWTSRSVLIDVGVLVCILVYIGTRLGVGNVTVLLLLSHMRARLATNFWTHYETQRDITPKRSLKILLCFFIRKLSVFCTFLFGLLCMSVLLIVYLYGC